LETAETRRAFKVIHIEGMLRCVECSADVGLTFALQYVYASEETMRVSQDSLASLGLFAAVVDGLLVWLKMDPID
jgi:hypothetical protein